MSDEEAKGTDYLARTIYEPEKIGRIGFVHHPETINMIKTKPKPSMPPKKPGKGGKKC